MRSALADWAAILLSLEALVMMLVPLAITLGLAVGVHWLRRKLRPLFQTIHKYLEIVRHAVERGTSAAAAPLIKLSGLGAQLGALRKGLPRLIGEEKQ